MIEDEILELSPPSSFKAEQLVLGSLLLDNRVFGKVISVMSASDFHYSDHRLIFLAISHLLNSDLPADVLTVLGVLKKIGQDQNIGGLAYLNTIATNTTSTENVRRYAEIVRGTFIRRSILEIGQDMLKMVREPESFSVGAIIEHAQERLFALSNTKPKANNGLQHISVSISRLDEPCDCEVNHPNSQ